MFAIVEIAGKQFKVTPDQKIYTHRIKEANEGDTLTFHDVYLVDNGSIHIGTPKVSGASVTAKVITPLVKADKVLIFKKKRRKGYQKLNGFRHQHSYIQIESISI
jgi:large subunit ribosomal protein L21